MKKNRLSLVFGMLGLAAVAMADWSQAAPADVDAGFGADGEGANDEVYSVSLQPDGKVLVGGLFTAVSDGGATFNRNGFVRMNADGTVDSGFGVNAGGLSPFPAFGIATALQPDGKVVIGGGFTTITDGTGSTSRDNLARFNADGSVDSSFGAASEGTNGLVRALAILPDGKILVAGNFTTVSDGTGTYNRNRIARFNADGTVDTTFGSDAKGASATIQVLAVQPDGKILVGGTFSTITDATTSASRSRIARLNADGSVDTSFGSDGNGASSAVQAIAVQPDGKILIGGSFGSISDATVTATRLRVARLNADGSVDTAFGADSKGVDVSVTSIALQADGKIILGGNFATVSDATTTANRKGVARLNTNGSVDTSFGADMTGTDQVFSLMLQEDGKLLVGGIYTAVDGPSGSVLRNRIARLENDTASSQATVPNRSTFRWLLGGAAPQAGRVSVEVSTDNGITYTELGDATSITGGWELTGVSIPLVSKVRARAYLVNGGTGTGIVEKVVDVNLTNPPRLTIAGKKSFTTTKSKVTLRGTASDPDGDLTAVRYTAGGRSTLARGTASWSAAVKLKPGSNRIQIQAFDSRSVPSAVGRVTVKRK